MQDYLTKKKMEKERAMEWANTDPPIKDVGEEPEVAELPGLTPEPSMTRSETTRSETNGLHRVASSPRSDTNPLNRVGSSPRLIDDSPSANPTAALVSFSAPQAQQPGLRLVNATVKSVVSVGEGDRVSVDLCNLLNPGEALLVS